MESIAILNEVRLLQPAHLTTDLGLLHIESILSKILALYQVLLFLFPSAIAHLVCRKQTFNPQFLKRDVVRRT
jgi:hypothetical protein